MDPKSSAHKENAAKHIELQNLRRLQIEERFLTSVSVYLLILGLAIVLPAVFATSVLGLSLFHGYLWGGVGWLCTYLSLHYCFPRWTWNGYGPVIPIKKAVLVTCCDTPLGYRLVKQLDGLVTVFAGTNKPDCEYIKKIQKECTTRVVIMPLDVTSDKSVTMAIENIEEYLEKANHDFWGIINNTMATSRGEVEWVPVETFQRLAEINLYGMVRITKACLPWIRRNRGRIINVTDTRGRWTVPGCAAYAMTRYGVESFSDALRYEMQQWGVKVSVVEICKKFEGVCDVIDNKNLWDELDKKAQRHYGKSYYDDCIASWDEDLKGGDKHIGIIVRKTLDAVWSRIPRDRYVIGSLSDQVKTFMYTSLPSFITDGPIKESYSSKVTPTVLH